MDERKELKELTLKEIEKAIGDGVSEETQTPVTATIQSISHEDRSMLGDDVYNITLTLKVPSRYSEGSFSSDFKEEDLPF